MEEKIKKSYFDRFQQILQSLKQRKIAIFTHPTPDPDAIGSMLGIGWLLKKIYDIECDYYSSGCISHPQNIALCNLLDVNLIDVSKYNSNKGDYGGSILVDTIPSNTFNPSLQYDIVIDHHKDTPNGGFNGLFINLKAGSCCATVCDIINSHNIFFEDGNDQDSKVATALLIGIITDTNNLMSDDTSNLEFSSYSKLFEFRDSNILKDIVNFKRPKSWVDIKSNAVNNVYMKDDGLAIVGIGLLSGKDRDLISDMSDEMLTWANVDTAVVFAVIDGSRIEGSVRSSNPAVAVASLCNQLVLGKQGTGGGKLGKGAYRYDLIGLFEGDEDEDSRKEMWDVIQKKEIKRILKIV